MLSLTFDEFKKRAGRGALIPLYTEVSADLETPVSAFLKIRSGKYDFLLESVQGGEKWGQYSFLGSYPRAIFKSKGKVIEIIEQKKRSSYKTKTDALSELKKFLKKYKPVKVSGLPRFYGGAVGYLAYDMVRHFETLPDTARDDLASNDCFFMITDTVVLFDNFRQMLKVVANVHLDGTQSVKKSYDEAKKKIEGLIQKLKKPIPSFKKNSKKSIPKALKVIHTEKEFCTLVERVKEYIKAGDVFQTVISTRFEGETNVSPFELYRSICRLNPSPYLYFLQCEDVAVVGASPEVMVRLEDGKVELRPIAGTRKRGRTKEKDQYLEKELVGDPKERAEHIMLVDLGRNDLGRISQVGTVHLDEQEVVERYSHVMHLVSHVSGQLKKGRDAFDVLKATFPAGTLSGAPKIRAMEIIEELEGVRRGIYGGCVGYISFTGNLDTAITIRTAVFKGKKIYIQAGAGIVYNSIPKLEYKECCHKAMGMIAALKTC